MKVTSLIAVAAIMGTQRGAGGEDALRRLIARAGLESQEDSDSDAASH